MGKLYAGNTGKGNHGFNTRHIFRPGGAAPYTSVFQAQGHAGHGSGEGNTCTDGVRAKAAS